MRRLGVLVAVLLLVLVVWWSWPTTTTTTSTPPPEVVSRAPPSRVAPMPVAAPKTPEDLPREEASALQAHQRIGEALGGVSIRCHVGSQLDDVDIDGGSYERRIESGWFSDVVPTLVGSRQIMESPDVEGDNERKPLFEVRWEATEAPSVVPCEVRWPEYAELVVHTKDGNGDPMAGVMVSGCTLDGITKEDGVLRRQVAVGDRCLVMGHLAPWLMTGGELPRDQRVVEDLVAGESRVVELLMVPASEADPMEQLPPPPPVDWAIDPTATASGVAARGARVRALLLDATGTEAEVIEDVAEMLEMAAWKMSLSVPE